MNRINHYAILAHELSAKDDLFKGFVRGEVPVFLPDLIGKNGVFLSSLTLDKFIDDELKHDNYTLTKESHRSLLTLSSGEKKKALLNYVLKRDWDFIALDHPYDNLDIGSQQVLEERLKDLSRRVVIVQFFSRNRELLPFINKVIEVGKEGVVFQGNRSDFEQYSQCKQKMAFVGKIPLPLDHFSCNKELVLFKDVCVRYEDRKILNQINWTIKKGEFWQLVGPNGSGKTTLLTMVIGDNPKAFGQDLYLFGKKKGTGETVWEIKDKIGYYTSSMMDLFSVRHTVENMIVSGFMDSIGLYKVPSEMQLRLADEWLELLGMTKKRTQAFVDLPVGEQRLVLIARAMVKHPPLLILDEPTTGLDDAGAEILVSLINKMAEESGTAIIYVSHRNEEGLKPEFTFELVPSAEGSMGQIVKH